MNRQLAPLNGLRAFEAAARHLSLSKAARELNVTPAAVSHQVKGLEEYLGVQLFRRLNKSLLLTDAGQMCLPGLQQGFDRLAEAVAAARAGDETRPITVTAPPTLAAKWLVPRLGHFNEAYPNIQLRLDASAHVVDLVREDVDVAIRYGAGDYPGMVVLCLFDQDIAPVCSPCLLSDSLPLREPADLCNQTLLHVDEISSYPDWRMWLKSAGVVGCNENRGPHFTQNSLALEAAIEGQGIALMDLVVVDSELKNGRLVKPFDVGFPTKFAHYLVYPLGHDSRPRVAAFRDWILTEVAVTAQGSSA